MAKVRVYELAKELNIESKALVDKLIEGGISIKNYMSTLDEKTVEKARGIISGNVSAVIEERRIKPTVIRRRKKIVKVKKDRPDKKVAADELVEEPSTDLAEEGVQESVSEKIVTKEKDEEPSLDMKREAEHEKISEVSIEAEEIEEEKKEAGDIKEVPKEDKGKEKSKQKKAKKKKADRPAKIIKRPEEGPLQEIIQKKAQEPSEQPVETTETTKISTKAPDDEASKIVKKKRGGKKKKGVKTEEEIEKVPKAIIRSRRREVYEKADLYETFGFRKKEKKRGKSSKEATRKGKQTQITVPKAIKRRIKIQESVTVGDLSKAMGIKATDVIKKLMHLGAAASINQSLDYETAQVVADEFGYELELDTFEEDRFISNAEDNPEDMIPRPPVITIMGHVDHGKTSLLDYIRKSNIIGGESGGITQHIGAYYVKTEGGDIVFLDTPGHEAFTAMRARGAKVTDLIVLVVASDDGVMPQTREAVNHARAANIPIVVAINKMDKPEANPEKVKRELAELDLAPEEWGGDTIYAHISAKTGEGVDELLNLILLQAEMLELKGNPNRSAMGSVIEAKLDKNKGPVATVLISKGTLKSGDFFVCGEHYGRVRAMLDHHGKKMKLATPSMPVEIYGISGVPMAGDEFAVVDGEKTAKQIIEHRKSKARSQRLGNRGLTSLDDLYEKIKQGGIKELNIVIKADVQGSVEALKDSLAKQGTDEVKLKIIHTGTGAITESDVMLASASGAIIIGFNVRANPRVREIAENENVDIRYYDVIYNVVNDVRMAMAGLLEPVYEEQVIGRASIKETFHVPKIGAIAGCQVTEGRVERNANVRLLRDEVVVFDGKISSLRRFKDDVKEVQKGYDCGIGLENFQDIKPGDVFEVYKIEQVEAEL
jgi:translation initiation factor IF-2